MSHADEMIRNLATEAVRKQFRFLYGEDEQIVKAQEERYAALIRRHAELFGDRADGNSENRPLVPFTDKQKALRLNEPELLCRRLTSPARP